jgi:hypothetical protein
MSRLPSMIARYHGTAPKGMLSFPGPCSAASSWQPLCISLVSNGIGSPRIRRTRRTMSSCLYVFVTLPWLRPCPHQLRKGKGSSPVKFQEPAAASPAPLPASFCGSISTLPAERSLSFRTP